MRAEDDRCPHQDWQLMQAGSLHQRMGSLVKADWCPQLTEGRGEGRCYTGSLCKGFVQVIGLGY
jgi:hypothetical protein